MTDNRLLHLMSRKLAGEATAEELEEIDNMLLHDRDAEESFKQLQRYWNRQENVDQFYVQKAFDKIIDRLDLPVATPVVEMPGAGNRFSWKRFRPVAAAAVIMLLVTVVFNKTNKFTEQYSALVAKESPKGVKQTFVLADGSKIWLNADSKIRFPEQFSGATRDVYLNGEAFFEVAKNPSKPFIIHLANGTIRVLGTSFNVRAYDNDKIVETSVATGKVAFIPKYLKREKEPDTVFLSAENKVRYFLLKEELSVEPTVSKEDRAWIAGKLVFKALTLEEIGLQLERTFGKKFVFKSDDARLFRLTGAFQNNSLEEILFYLSKSKSFDYTITNVEVLISVETDKLPE